MSGEPLDKLSKEAISFCQTLGSEAVTVSDILKVRDPMVYTAIQYGIDMVNQQAISDSHRIRKWIILEKDFSIQGGELGESLGSGLSHLGSGPYPSLGAKSMRPARTQDTYPHQLGLAPYWPPYAASSPGQTPSCFILTVGLER